MSGRDVLGSVGVAVLAPLVVVLAASLLVPEVSWLRWDNFEFYAPVLPEVHGQWLQGTFPAWNPHQCMGDPNVGQGVAGVFYAPYALCLFGARAVGLGDDDLLSVVALAHACLGGAGWFLLFVRLGVRPSLAQVGALSAGCSGFALVFSSLWIVVAVQAAWLPWLLLGVAGLVGPAGRPRHGGALVAALVALGVVGYPQLWVYGGLWALACGAAWASLAFRRPARLLPLVVPVVAGLLLAAPAVLPLLELRSHSPRSGHVSRDEFLVRSVTPAAWAGALLPLDGRENGFLTMRASVMTHAGAWVVPALLAAAVLGGGGGGGGPSPGRLALVTGLATLPFILCSLGAAGGLYPLLYGLPLWSSLRWPFKWLFVAVPGLAVTATLALEAAASRLEAEPSRWRSALAAALAAGALAVASVVGSPSPHLSSAAGSVCLVAGLLAMLSVAALGSPAGRALFVAAAVLESVGFVGLCHDLGLRTYREPYATGAARLGLDAGHRYLPASPAPYGQGWGGGPTCLQELGLFSSATMNGLACVSGSQWGFAPRWFLDVVPTLQDGSVATPAVAALVDSHLLRALDVRWVVVGRHDVEGCRLLAGSRTFRLVRELEHALVYEGDGALGAAWFADEARPYGMAELSEGLVQNRAGPRTAYVEQAPPEGAPSSLYPLFPVPFSSSLPPATVSSAEFTASGWLLSVSAPSGGLLVVSTTWYPEWAATVDGLPAPVWRVDGTLVGVPIPPGSREVRMGYRSRGLTRGLWLAAAGLLLFVGWWRRMARSCRP